MATMLCTLVSFSTSSTRPLAPARRSSPPLCFSSPHTIMMMPTPVLSTRLTLLRSSTTFFSLSRTSAVPIHSRCWASRPRIILPASSRTITSGGMRLEWISSMGFPFLQRTCEAHEVCPVPDRKSNAGYRIAVRGGKALLTPDSPLLDLNHVLWRRCFDFPQPVRHPARKLIERLGMRALFAGQHRRQPRIARLADFRIQFHPPQEGNVELLGRALP